jgi:hypothetical protein
MRTRLPSAALARYHSWMRRWIALGVAAVGVVWTPYLYSEWTASRARQRAQLDDDEVQQPSAATSETAARESQLSAAEDHGSQPKPAPPAPQPVPVAPDPSLQRRGEAVAAAMQKAMPMLTARIPDTAAPMLEQQPERSPDAPLTTRSIDSPKPPPQAAVEAAAANEPPRNEPTNAAPADEPTAHEAPAQEPSAQEPANTPAPGQAPAHDPNNPAPAQAADNAAPSNEAPEP